MCIIEGVPSSFGRDCSLGINSMKFATDTHKFVCKGILIDYPLCKLSCIFIASFLWYSKNLLYGNDSV